jgi:hypothetical protein
VIAKLPRPKTAAVGPLIGSAERAVQALAARRGITLQAASEKKGHPWRDRLVIVAGVLVLVAIAIVVRMVVRRR